MTAVLPTILPRQKSEIDEYPVNRAVGILSQGASPAARLLTFLRSTGVKHSLITAVAMGMAGVLDYGVSVVAGRWLVPIEYGVFVSVAALMQVLVQLTNAIRSVVAFYTAELSLKKDGSQYVSAFVQRVWRWACRWGLVATAVMAVVTPILGRALRLPNNWPLWVAAPVVLLFFVRTVTDGALQGLQSFGGFGVVQVVQSLLRLLFAAGLIRVGFQASGAVGALPLAMAAALILAVWLLRPYFQARARVAAREVSWHYSSHTLMGFAALALLANMDALFVKHFYSPALAGDYGPVVTLAKISLFLPMSLGVVLLPKATQRCASGRDPRPVLLLALAATLLPGFALTGIYFMFPGFLVRTIFGAAYSNLGLVLGMSNLAASLYAGLNIWLSYSLSVNRPAFIYCLAGVLVCQGLGMYILGRDSFWHMTIVMALGGLAGNLAGVATMSFSTWTAEESLAH